MKTIHLLLAAFVFLFTSNAVSAQNNILAGKVTDENNKPVSGATVKLHKGDENITAKTDADGLYCTEPFKPAKYLVTIIFNDKIYIAKEITVPAAGKDKKYYNFSLKGEKATLAVTATDPFMAAKLAKIKNEDPRKNVLDNGKTGTFRIDSAGKVKESRMPAEAPPKP